jgi:formylglycine-generating enzyme required for sulfatase activity
MSDVAKLVPPPFAASSTDARVRRGMVRIPGGSFLMGSDKHYLEERPAHAVEVDAFWMDLAPVTNREFAEFVEATGHLTLAETAPEPGSMVFQPPAHAVDLHWVSWWRFRAGADWRHPGGPDSSLAGLDRHPVVHVSWSDAEAYAKWAGKALPREAEWEFAARGGLEGAEFAWGALLTPDGRHMANTWQGEFPHENTCGDGHAGTSPVGSFPPNGYGLLDMIGNVWEWTADWYSRSHARSARRGGGAPRNPQGGPREQSYDLAEPRAVTPRKVIKGGSYLCSPNYCRRYRPAARDARPLGSPACHIGFRCVVRERATG